jgi:Cnl2/NKP2 family protein
MSQPTESTLLTRFLLPPSSLPTIIPYNTFLTLLPSTIRSTVTGQPHSGTARLVKRLYQDLQFQRDIDIDAIAGNITRECARSQILHARLRREVRDELGYGDPTPSNSLTTAAGTRGTKNREVISNKRKRDDDEPSNENSESESDEDDDKEDGESTTLTEHPLPLHTQRTKMSPNPASQSKPPTHHDPLTSPFESRIDILFTGVRGLAAPLTNPIPQRQKYHSTTSLLSAMETAVKDLEAEIEGLEKRSKEVMEGMRETVGGMSDLRYGRFARVGVQGQGQGGRGSASGEGVSEIGEGGLEEQVSVALKELRQVVGKKMRENGK